MMRTRYAITHVGKDGLRTLTFTNQGPYHYDRREDAEAALALYKPSLVDKKILTAAQGETLRVRAVECYDHGDATRTIFDDGET